MNNGIIDRWADEAAEDLGKKTWREVSPNSLMLIIYKMERGREKRLLKPLWSLFGIVATGTVGGLLAVFLGKFGG